MMATPLRQDYYLYNEACAFVLTSASQLQLAADRRYDEPEAWAQGVREGLFFPVELWQDDGFVARLVIGDLSAQEQAEWVGRVGWKLNVADGRLAILAGADYMVGAAEPKPDDEYMHVTDIPAGSYRVTSYAFLNSTNGAPNLEKAGVAWEDMGTYFHRTRPGMAPPDWMRLMFDDVFEVEAGLFDRVSEYGLVQFLFHLQPLAGTHAELDMPPLHDDLFRETEYRKPDQCPLGIPAIEVIKPPNL